MIKFKHQGGDNMISKRTKIFTIGGKEYQFDFQSFKAYVKRRAQAEEIRPTKYLVTISQAVNVTVEATKQWYYGNNGPSDLEIVQKIAEVLNISNYLELMKETKESEQMVKLNMCQAEALKRIYDAIIDYLNDFYKTDGFTGALWYEFQYKGSNDPEADIYQYAEDKIEAVLLVIQKEYFYLHDVSVYGEISEYAENDLYDIFDGKLSYAYRFEAIPDGNPTTMDDYNKALKRLNEIIEKYI